MFGWESRWKAGEWLEVQSRQGSPEKGQSRPLRGSRCGRASAELQETGGVTRTGQPQDERPAPTRKRRERHFCPLWSRFWVGEGEGLRWKLRWSMTGRCGEAGQFTSSWIPLGLSPGRDPMPPKSSLRLPGRCWGQGDPPLMGHRHPASRGRASLEEGLGREHTAPPSPSPERERVAETDKDTDPQNTLWEAHPEPVLSSQTWILPGG